MSEPFPENFGRLHEWEEALRHKALSLIAADAGLSLHLAVVEQAMDVADLLRQVPTEDEDLKVVQMLGMRLFNAFAAGLKLALSGYGQNSALILRGVLETVFLVDYFGTDRAAIARWRIADAKARRTEFAPVKIRDALDERDGFTGKKRARHYTIFSELAAHPTMKSVWMMRPQKDGDAVSGPFVEKDSLKAVLEEMGRLAVSVGELLCPFFPDPALRARLASMRRRSAG